MGVFRKKKNKAEAADLFAQAGFGEPKKNKKQSRKEKKQGDIWKYKVKWGQSVNDASFNNLSQLVNYVASQSDFLVTHKMEDTIVAYKVNQDEVLDYALEIALPLNKEVEEVFTDFDSKERKPFARSLVTKGPAAQQEAARLAEEKEEVVDEFTQQQEAFGKEALARVQEKQATPLTRTPEATESHVSNDWGMLGKVTPTSQEEATEAEKNVSRPYPPVTATEDKKVEAPVQEDDKPAPAASTPVEEADEELVTIEVAATADEAPQAVSAEDSVLDSLIKAQFQLSKELDIDKEALLKAEIEKKATASLKKAQAEAIVSSKIELEKAKRNEIKRHEEMMKQLEEDAKEELDNEKEALSARFADEAANDFKEQRVVLQEKHDALLERKEELDNQIEAFKELLG